MYKVFNSFLKVKIVRSKIYSHISGVSRNRVFFDPFVRQNLPGLATV